MLGLTLIAKNIFCNLCSTNALRLTLELCNRYCIFFARLVICKACDSVVAVYSGNEEWNKTKETESAIVLYVWVDHHNFGIVFIVIILFR